MLAKMPSTRIHFSYELYNESNTLINVGETTLAFIDVKKNSPCSAPKDFVDKIKSYFEQK